MGKITSAILRGVASQEAWEGQDLERDGDHLKAARYLQPRLRRHRLSRIS